ncbi:hypothetical protein LDENG_00200050 [Lucifuga dentata]|nr:hypothetical protein LDENG_00200050 [Lucifuga dentata]
MLQFYILNRSTIPIFGGEACEELAVSKRVDALATLSPATKEELVEMHPTVFTGLGEFPGVHHMHIDPNIMPVVHGCRSIPLSVIDKLKDTLQDLEKRDVITAVTEPTEWVNSLVVTEKKTGALRVCLDLCDLNKAIKHQLYSCLICRYADGINWLLRKRDQLQEVHLARRHFTEVTLVGKSIFTLDEKDGYWQIKLDKTSSKLCTFNTPWGRFRILRLPFGVKSASEVFQQKNCEIFGGIQGVHIIADDMIIAASSNEEHDEILHKVMERAKTANVKFETKSGSKST